MTTLQYLLSIKFCIIAFNFFLITPSYGETIGFAEHIEACVHRCQKNRAIPAKRHNNKEFTGIEQHQGSNGSIIVQNWKQGLLHGEQIKYYPNGQIESKISYAQGKKAGRAACWYPDGTKKWIESSGYYYYWHPNGQIFIEGPINKGVAFGEWNVYDEKGKLLSKGTFRNGKAWNGKFFISNYPEITVFKNGIEIGGVFGDD